MSQAADRGSMAMTIKQLRNASDDDLIDAHDHAARYVSPGVSYYLDELRRRDTARAMRAGHELTRRDYWRAAGAAEVTMSSFVLSTIASSSPRSRSGTPNFARVWWKSSMNASHSAPEIRSSRCESSIVSPE